MPGEVDPTPGSRNKESSQLWKSNLNTRGYENINPLEGARFRCALSPIAIYRSSFANEIVEAVAGDTPARGQCRLCMSNPYLVVGSCKVSIILYSSSTDYGKTNLNLIPRADETMNVNPKKLALILVFLTDQYLC